jgi:hypothetical protein
VLQRGNVVQQIESGRKDLEAELARGYDYAPEAFSVIAGPRQPRSITLPILPSPPPAAAAPAPARGR